MNHSHRDGMGHAKISSNLSNSKMWFSFEHTANNIVYVKYQKQRVYYISFGNRKNNVSMIEQDKFKFSQKYNCHPSCLL